jgi:hypothetical protein
MLCHASACEPGVHPSCCYSAAVGPVTLLQALLICRSHSWRPFTGRSSQSRTIPHPIRTVQGIVSGSFAMQAVRSGFCPLPLAGMDRSSAVCHQLCATRPLRIRFPLGPPISLARPMLLPAGVEALECWSLYFETTQDRCTGEQLPPAPFHRDRAVGHRNHLARVNAWTITGLLRRPAEDNLCSDQIVGAIP